jgi:hypothetical protein
MVIEGAHTVDLETIPRRERWFWRHLVAGLLAATIALLTFQLSRPVDNLMLYVGPTDQYGEHIKVLVPAGWLPQYHRSSRLRSPDMISFTPPTMLPFLPAWLRRLVVRGEGKEAWMRLVISPGVIVAPGKTGEARTAIARPDGTKVQIGSQFIVDESRKRVVVWQYSRSDEATFERTYPRIAASLRLE